MASQRQSPGLSNSVTCGFTYSSESATVHRGLLKSPIAEFQVSGILARLFAVAEHALHDASTPEIKQADRANRRAHQSIRD